MLSQILKNLVEQDNYRYLRSLSRDGAFVRYNGQRLLNLASNDYLHLSADEDLKKAFFAEIRASDFYFSSSSSRSLSGNFEIYERFEEAMARHFCPKEVLHFNSGYHLNISCIQALSTLPHTLLIADKFIHASVIDGLRLGGGKFIRFKHNDMAHLESLLQKHHKMYRHIIIITEALFSMDGDFAPLLKLVEYKKTYPNILLYVDEAHSVGCFDDSGLGYAKSIGVEKDIDFLVFTFGKAIASMGACMITHKDFKSFFVNKARAFIYSTALPPLNVAWSHFIFKNLDSFVCQRQKLSNISRYFKGELSKSGFEILGDAHIVSLLCGGNDKANQYAQKLLSANIFAPAIKEPTVPKNTARIRFCLHSGLDEEALEGVLKAI